MATMKQMANDIATIAQKDHKDQNAITKLVLGV